MVLGLPNPREWNATQGVYFHLSVFEVDLNFNGDAFNGGLVIRVFEHLQLQIGVETGMFTFSYGDPTQTMITLSFRVVCASGFTGGLTLMTVLHGVNCSGNGVYVDSIDSFTCNCNTGYNGTQCDMNLDECLSNPCGTNGKCMNQEGTSQCTCDPDFIQWRVLH